jgi:hypothetical protein
MKKVIAFFKGLFSAPAQPVVAAPVAKQEAPKAKQVVVSEPETAPKKKKRYYKPKA